MIARVAAGVAVLVAVTLVVALNLPSANSTVVFQDEVSASSIRSWSVVQSAREGRVRVAPAPGASGLALRFEVREGDESFNGDASARAQLAWWEGRAEEGQDYRYSWSTYVPDGYALTDRAQELVQFKNDGPGAPPLSLGLQGDCLVLRAGPQAGHELLWSERLQRGRWSDFQLRVKWSPDARDGRVRLRFGGRSVTDRALATMYPGRANYPKIGLERDPAIEPVGVVYFRDFKIESLRPDGAADEPATRADAGRCVA